MTIAIALLFTALTLGQQPTSGVIIGPDIEGYVAIYDRDHRMVVDLDKSAGRQVQIALEPGAYEAQLGRDWAGRARFQIAEGQMLPLSLGSFEHQHPAVVGAPGGEPAAQPAPPPPSQHPHHKRSLDSRHRIEVRFGGWGDGWYDEHGHDSWQYTGSAYAAFGLEYLNFVRNDIGVGFAITSLAGANGTWDSWDE